MLGVISKSWLAICKQWKSCNCEVRFGSTAFVLVVAFWIERRKHFSVGNQIIANTVPPAKRNFFATRITPRDYMFAQCAKEFAWVTTAPPIRQHEREHTSQDNENCSYATILHLWMIPTNPWHQFFKRIPRPKGQKNAYSVGNRIEQRTPPSTSLWQSAHS